MSQLVRFEHKGEKYKTRVFETSSRKRDCICCGERRFGILFRHISPKKIPDTLICGECIVLISVGVPIKINANTAFGKFSKARIVANAKRRKIQAPGPSSEKPKVKCPECGKKLTKAGLTRHMRQSHKTKPVEPEVKEETNAEETVIEETSVNED